MNNRVDKNTRKVLTHVGHTQLAHWDKARVTREVTADDEEASGVSTWEGGQESDKRLS